MLDRLRRVLVESYVGAIAMGWILADCRMGFAKELPRVNTKNDWAADNRAISLPLPRRAARVGQDLVALANLVRDSSLALL